MPKVAYRAKRSRRKFNKSKEIKALLADFMDAEVKPHFVEQFEEIVADWKHKPDFKARKYIRADSIQIAVYPAGEHKLIWKYVSRGTRRHKIRAKNAPFLVFPWGGKGSYRPKTRPSSGIAGPSFRGLGKVVGGKTVRFKEVDHPGNKPRKFEEWIADREKDWYSREMENAWRRILRAV